MNGAQRKTRVLVVEDSLTVRGHIVAVLSADPEIEVIGEASDGKLAIELCAKLRPDAVTLDMMLPVMSGLAATEYIMAYCPTPILIVSASTNRGELFKTYEALSAGALDVLDKPQGDASDELWGRHLVDAVKRIARIRVITHPRARLERFVQRRSEAAAPAPPTRAGRGPVRLVTIGASTGGPRAIVEILRSLPATFSLPILVVVHLGDKFGGAFAEWLDGVSPLRATFAADGDPLPPPGKGCVLLAPPDRHLVVEGARLRLTNAPERHSCRPSVDALFESVASLGEGVAACLLSGMGRDGAQGLLAIRHAGGATIAQDEATSVVWGMPGEAVRLNAAERVLGIEHIGPAIIDLAGPSAGRRR